MTDRTVTQPDLRVLPVRLGQVLEHLLDTTPPLPDTVVLTEWLGTACREWAAELRTTLRHDGRPTNTTTAAVAAARIDAARTAETIAEHCAATGTPPLAGLRDGAATLRTAAVRLAAVERPRRQWSAARLLRVLRPAKAKHR